MANQINIGQLIRTLGETGRYSAKDILVKVRGVFPQAETSLKSIYSTCCVAGIKLPGSRVNVVNQDALTELLKELVEANGGVEVVGAALEATGTEG